MPILHTNMDDPNDVRASITILKQHLNGSTVARQLVTEHTQPLAQAMAEMKRKKIWRFLERVAGLSVPEYSLPELGGQVGMSSNKVCSLKAILAKPEQRLGVQFFEAAPSGSVDAAGNPRYRMPEVIKQAIQNT